MSATGRRATDEIEISPEMIEAAMNYWTKEWGYEWPQSEGSVREFFAVLYRIIASAERPR
jgi:hypothetical protein